MENLLATAGTSDKGDVFIRLIKLKKGSGIDIALESRVKLLYEEEILKTVNKKLKALNISDVRIEIKDEAAFDYVINARLETAVRRAFQAGIK
jgi:citrate lyase subunit gamma (acyl carrier protein)